MRVAKAGACETDTLTPPLSSPATSACYEDMLGVTIPADGTDREFLLALKAEWAKLVEQVGSLS